MDNIKCDIVPIFYPDAKICEDFERIELLCDTYLGNVYTEEYRQSCAEYHRNNIDEENAFAFAAYHKNQKVGFTDGYVQDDSMNLDSLFVDPTFFRSGIGNKLLKVSEQAASLVKSDMSLLPLFNAIGFYQRYGYEYGKDGTHMMKSLPRMTSGIVPVFKWSDVLQEKLNFKFDTKMLQQYEHQPIFVYVNPAQRIDGVATRLANGKDFIKYNDRTDKVKAKYRTIELSDALYNIR